MDTLGRNKISRNKWLVIPALMVLVFLSVAMLTQLVSAHASPNIPSMIARNAAWAIEASTTATNTLTAPTATHVVSSTATSPPALTATNTPISTSTATPTGTPTSTPRPGAIFGRAFLRVHNGHVAKNASVYAYKLDGTYVSRVELTNNDGYYWITNLPPGTYMLRADPPSGYDNLLPAGLGPIVVEEGQTVIDQNVVFRVPVRPPSGVTILPYSWSGETRDDGIPSVPWTNDITIKFKNKDCPNGIVNYEVRDVFGQYIWSALVTGDGEGNFKVIIPHPAPTYYGMVKFTDTLSVMESQRPCPPSISI